MKAAPFCWGAECNSLLERNPAVSPEQPTALPMTRGTLKRDLGDAPPHPLQIMKFRQALSVYENIIQTSDPSSDLSNIS